LLVAVATSNGPETGRYKLKTIRFFAAMIEG